MTNEKINWGTFALALAFAFAFTFIFELGATLPVVFVLSVFTLYCFFLRVPKLEFPPRKVSVVPFQPIRKFRKK